MTSATQKSSTAFNLTFDSKLTASTVSALDFTVYYKLNGADVKLPVNSFAINTTDSTKAVLSVWQSLNAGTEYLIKYTGDDDAITVKAATLKPEDAVSVIVDTKDAVVNELTPIKYTVVDANGIEIPGVFANVTFETGDTSICGITDNSIVFYEKNKTATVKYTYTTWYTNGSNNYVEHKFSGESVIVSKEAAAVTVAAQKWTVAGTTAVDFTASDFVQNDRVAANDTTNNYLQVYLKLSDDSIITSSSINHAFTYKSADNNVLVMNDNQILPVKPGSTQILVYLDGATTPTMVVPMTIGQDRIPTTITASASKNNVNSNYTDDFVDINVLVKDNYGKPYNGATVKYERVSGLTLAANDNAATTDINGKATFTLNVNDEIAAAADGALSFKVCATAGDKTTNVIVLNVTVKPIVATANTQKLVLSTTEIDTKIASGSALSAYGITVNAADYNGSYQLSTAAQATWDTGSYGNNFNGYVFTLYRGATKISNVTGATETIGDGFINTVSVKDNKASKLPAGDYKVQLYKVVTNASGVVTTKSLVDTKTLTIKDSQPTMTWTKILDTVNSFNSSTGFDQAFNIVYKDTSDLTLMSDSVACDTNLSFTTVPGTSSIYVKSAEYTLFMADGYEYVVSRTIGTTLSK